MKKIFYVILIVLVIAFAIYFAKEILEEEKETFSSNVNNNIQNSITNTEENSAIINETNNEISNETINNEVQNGTNIENTILQEEISDEEKAKKIVKKDWGEDNKVYFTVETTDNTEEYIVFVREKSTTKKLYKYTVNVSTGKFTSELEAY